MLHKITENDFRGHGPIQMLYPGVSISNTDSGIGSIGRIDHAKFHGRQHIPMHPHVNDEILSYFRTGKVQHIDSEGFKSTVGGQRLMLMKAGKQFSHEEFIEGDVEPFEGLQIFIRPGEKDLKPEVIFRDLEQLYSDNEWRLLASPSSATVFQLSSKTWLYDIRTLGGNTIDLPTLPTEDLTGLLYVYQGSIQVNKKIELNKKESLVFKDEAISIYAERDAELVLFFTDEDAPIFKGGMFSGNSLIFN